MWANERAEPHFRAPGQCRHTCTQVYGSNGGTQHDECRGHTLAHVYIQSGILRLDVSRLACALKPRARDHRDTGCKSPEQNMRTALGRGSGQRMGVKMKGAHTQSQHHSATQRPEHVHGHGTERGKRQGPEEGPSLPSQVLRAHPGVPAFKPAGSPSSQIREWHVLPA